MSVAVSHAAHKPGFAILTSRHSLDASSLHAKVTCIVNEVPQSCIWEGLHGVSCCLLELLRGSNQIKGQHLNSMRGMLANAFCLHPLYAYGS